MSPSTTKTLPPPPMPPKRTCGWKPRRKDAPPRPTFRYGQRQGVKAPDRASLAAFMPRPIDQGQTSACTGHAWAVAIFCALGAIGKALAWLPSPTLLYVIGRALGLGDAKAPLTDDGANPDDVIAGANEIGVCPSRNGFASDADPKTINDRPTLEEVVESAHHVEVGQHEIKDTGRARVLAICAAIAAGYPVTVALDASALDTYKAGDVIAQLGSNVDHEVMIYAFDTVNGRVRFRFRNSWGEEWGDAGDFVVDEGACDALVDLVVASVHPTGG